MKEPYDPLDLTTQQENDKARKMDEKVAAKQDIDDFLWLMRNKQGRRFMWRLLTWTHIFKSSFTGNSETFFREGERNIGVRLMDEIHSNCPELYSTMVKEQKNDRANDSDGGSNQQ